MLTNLSQTFIDNINNTIRSPIQLLEFHFPLQILYVSDQTFEGNANFTNVYLPYVESWGTLNDNVNIEPVLKQNSIESRQLSITLLNNQVPPFSSYFRDNPPENIKVYLYQLFEGMLESEKVLVDIFVCQSPILISEKNILINIDLVSLIMQKNPFIAGLESIRDKKYPYVIGKAEKLVGQRIDENPVTVLENDLAYDDTVLMVVENAIGFPSSGYIIIDSEIIGYSTWMAGGFKTLARGQFDTTARPHYRGAKVMVRGNNYDFALCTGPITNIDNILLDGNAFANNYEISTTSNPAYIRFFERLPYFFVEQGEPGEPIVFDDTTTNKYGTSYQLYQLAETYSYQNLANINLASGDAVLSVSEARPANISKTYFGVDYTLYTYGSYSSYGNVTGITTGIGISQFVGKSNGGVTQVGLFSQQIKSSRDYQSLLGGTFNKLVINIKFRTIGNSTRSRASYFGFRPKGSTQALQTLKTHEWGPTYDGNGYTPWYTDSYDATSGLGIDSYDKIYNYEFGALASSMQLNNLEIAVEIEFLKWVITYTPAYSATTKTIELVSKFNQDLSSIGTFKSASAVISYYAAAQKCTCNYKLIKRTSTDVNTNQQITSGSTTTSIALRSYETSLSCNSWAELVEQRVGVRFEMEGSTQAPGETRIATGYIRSVLWKITYQPFDAPTPSEERVVYGETVYADVTGIAGYPITPAYAIKSILNNIGSLGEYIDDSTFEAANTYYANLQYYFNGILSANYRFHDALKELLRQGCCRLCFNQGKIKLFYYTPNNNQTSKHFTPNERLLLSANEERTNTEDIENSILIKYNYNLKDEYFDDNIIIQDTSSVQKFGLLEGETELNLINNIDIVNYIGSILMKLKANPYSITSFTFFMSAYPIEKTDVITVETNFNNYITYAGEIITISRDFGSGKEGKINLFNVKCKRIANVAHVQEIIEQINVNDEYLFTGPYINHVEQIVETVNIADVDQIMKGSLKQQTINETININDVEEIICTQTGYGQGGYGQGGYGN